MTAVDVGRVPDDEWGERVVAWVVGDLSLDEARDWVAEVHPRSWAPRELRVLDAMPMLPNGKVDRRRLRGEPEMASVAEVRVFSIPMRVRFRGITVREGMLIRGDRRLG